MEGAWARGVCREGSCFSRDFTETVSWTKTEGIRLQITFLSVSIPSFQLICGAASLYAVLAGTSFAASAEILSEGATALYICDVTDLILFPRDCIGEHLREIPEKIEVADLHPSSDTRAVATLVQMCRDESLKSSLGPASLGGSSEEFEIARLI
jgi:hypothetical protein